MVYYSQALSPLRGGGTDRDRQTDRQTDRDGGRDTETERVVASCTCNRFVVHVKDPTTAV